MKTNKLERIKAAGWEVGSADDFLQLSGEESRLLALKLSLISAVKKSRIKRKLSQIDLAQRMKSSQSRIAKIEAGDASSTNGGFLPSSSQVFQILDTKIFSIPCLASV